MNMMTPISRFVIFASILLLIAIFAGSPAEAMRQQAVGARGRLFCGTRPASNVLVKLFDKDTGKLI
jgi:hypothetical protein